MDVELAERFCSLLQRLGVDRDTTTLGHMEKAELALLKSVKVELLFWQDGVKFMALVRRDHITAQRKLTNRKFAHIIVKFLNAGGAGQRGVETSVSPHLQSISPILLRISVHPSLPSLLTSSSLPLPALPSRAC